MSELSCQFSKILNLEAESKSLTVGEVFYLQCKGDLTDFDPKQAVLRADGSPEYVIQGLQVIPKGSDEVWILATSYLVGQHQLKGLTLVSGELVWPLSVLEFEVVSVIKEPIKEPFGPIAPMRAEFPMVLVYGLLATIFLVAALGFIRFRKRRAERLFRASMEALVENKDPDLQFFKTLRSLEKVNAWGGPQLQQLQNAVELYVYRQLQINAMQEMKSMQSVRDVYFLLRELKRFGKQPATLKPEDVTQLLAWSRSLPDSLPALRAHREVRR